MRTWRPGPLDEGDCRVGKITGRFVDRQDDCPRSRRQASQRASAAYPTANEPSNDYSQPQAKADQALPMCCGCPEATVLSEVAWQRTIARPPAIRPAGNLAKAGVSGHDELVHIPPPPLLQHLFLEQPWPVVIVLVGLAAIFRVVGRRRNKPWMNRVSLGTVVLAIGVYVLAWQVTTGREQLMAQTQQLIDATVKPLRMATLSSMIGPNTPIVNANHHLIARFGQVHHTLHAYPINGQSVTNLSATANGNTGLSRFSVTTRFKVVGVPLPSTWALAWRRDKRGRWRVTRIYWLKLRGQTPPNRIPDKTNSGLF